VTGPRDEPAAPLYLYDPPAPGPAWAPFAGVRPICELRAGIWRIRERWEGLLQAETAGIIASHVARWREFDEPEVIEAGAVRGPALIAASWFAPSGVPPHLPAGTRRLTSGGTTVGWLVTAGQEWEGPHDDGPGVEIEGLLLEGAWDLLTALEGFLQADCADFHDQPRDEIAEGSIVLGDPVEVISLGAHVEPGVVFDVRHGAIILEEGVEVRSGTRLEGPFYAGARSRLMGGYLRASVVGPWSVVRGEVSSSVFLGFSNKAHDGFVGHTVVGTWVNLGAGTTTSNLKNTYGEVSLEIAGHRLPTGRQFVGSLVGDHAKTAIGTLLPTGTVIGAGANLFGSAPVPKYVAPFAWGHASGERMSAEGFLRIAERVMPRRGVELTAERRESLEALHHRQSAAG
jgi:UDP-N-acetylglucosamine diphosphorylase/glucosamine-1-phosphate N-acetyltransferase